MSARILEMIVSKCRGNHDLNHSLVYWRDLIELQEELLMKMSELADALNHVSLNLQATQASLTQYIAGLQTPGDPDLPVEALNAIGALQQDAAALASLVPATPVTPGYASSTTQVQ